MRYRLDTIGFARPGHERRSRQRARHLGLRTWIGIASIVIGAGYAAAQDMSMSPPAEMGGWEGGGPPVTSMGEGSYFSQDLGTMVRARFNTRSYGQDARQDGNLDIGTMQVVNWDDSIAFFDGQITLSDVQGAGFNVGIGYRWLSYLPYATDGERITGVSLWGDGTSTEANNFFPQLGLSFESLGDIWDLRANGYIPIGQDNQVGNFVPTGEIGFQSSFISELAVATVDQSFYAGEIELARRMGHERDVWGFAGGYELVNDLEDTTGVRAGVRGYAYPDLLLQIAVSHDDIFETNTTFSLTWFIGRTRTNFHPACGVLDRFREPVMRNDYVALSQSTALGGTPLNDADGRVIRVVHVDSNAPSGGDGTFERPLNNLDDIDDNSQVRDIVFVHAESEFTGQSATLLANQRFLGEGDGIEHLVITEEEGAIPIPESSPGASDEDRPIIMAALGDAVTVGDLNEVSNFTIDGGTRGIVAGPSGSGNPNLHDLTIRNTTGDGIVLTPFVRVDTNDADNDGNVTESTVAFNVTIRDVTFDNIGGDDIDMDAFTNADLNDPDVTLQETITVSDVDSMNGNSRGVLLANTHEDGTFTLTNYTNTDGTTGATEGRLQFQDIAGDITISTAEILGGAGYAVGFLNVDSTSAVSITGLDYDGMTGAAGAIRANIFDGTMTVSSSTLQNGTLNGISLLNQSDGMFTFQNTVTMTNLGNVAGGIAFEIDGDPGGNLKQFTGVVSVANDIANDLGRSVVIRNITAAGTSVTFSGDITDTGQGVFINENTGGTVLFLGDLTITTALADPAIVVTTNTGADINFGGALDINTATGNGFQATGGGTLTVSNTGNSVTTQTGQIALITGMTISNAGVNFGEVNRTAGAATNAIQLENNTGGPILIGTVGDDAGESGTIAGGAADSILVSNSANVTISGLEINSVGAFSGIRVDKTNNNAMIVNVNDVETNAGDMGLEVNGNATTGNLNMTVNDTTVNNATAIGMLFNDVDAGTIGVNNGFVNGGGATAGIQILNSNATFNFDSATRIQGVTGTDFDVNGGTPVITMAGDITNTAGRSVQVQNVTGGSVNFTSTSSITDTGGGMRILTNTGGTFSFLGTNDFDPLDNTDAIVLTNNTGATMTFAGLNINTKTAGGADSTGRGFVATGGGTLSITGLTNIVETGNGAALELEDMTIGSVDFQRVTVDGTTGPVNAIIMRDLTGGQVAIGSTTGAINSGGIVEATGTAIILENVQNVDLRNMQIAANGNVVGDAGIKIDHTAAATTSMDVSIDALNLTSTNGIGIDVDGTNDSSAFNLRLRNSTANSLTYQNNVAVDITGAGAFGLLVDNIDINVSATTDTAFALNFSGNAQNGDVTFRNTVGSNVNDFMASSGSALSITTSSASAKTIDLLVEEGNFSNSNAANPAANFLSSGNTLMNATIEANTFSNSNGAGSDFTMTATGALARIRLKLGDADPANFNSAAGNGDFNLVEDLGADFDVFELTETFLNNRNNDTVAPQSPAGVANPAAFQDSPVAPPLPTVP